MKILIVGLGSIGQRHARNLRAIGGDRIELLAYRVRGSSPLLSGTSDPAGVTPEQAYGIRTVTDLGQALEERPDAAVIANPSSLHLAVARAAAEARPPR